MHAGSQGESGVNSHRAQGGCRAIAACCLLALLHALAPLALARAACAPPGPVLSVQGTLAGARVVARAEGLGALGMGNAPGPYLPFLAPAAVAARGNFVYVLDAGRRQVFIYDQAMQSMAPLARYDASSASALAVGADRSLYVADLAQQQVLHFSIDGRQLAPFRSQFDLVRPSALVLEQVAGALLVADSQYRHVVAFDSLGRVSGVLEPEPGIGIDAMARGPDGLYLVDRSSAQVHVLDRYGVPRYALGAGVLTSPGPIAVDSYNRVFVADGENSIKVFAGARLVSSEGAGSFSRIAALWLENDLLYVADSGAARVFIMRVAPPCPREVQHGP